MIAPELSVPNLLTLLRFLGIPVFIYLALGMRADGWAIFVLAIGGATDYFDGKLARAWNQTSRFGELADPAIDRLYILAILVVFQIREIIPVWMIIILIVRDVALGVLVFAMKRVGLQPFKVSYLGKLATFNLMYAFPFLLLAKSTGVLANLAFILGWSFAFWGITLYLSTGVSYARLGFSQLREIR